MLIMTEAKKTSALKTHFKIGGITKAMADHLLQGGEHPTIVFGRGREITSVYSHPRDPETGRVDTSTEIIRENPNTSNSPS